MKRFFVSSCFLVVILQCFTSTAAIDWFPSALLPSNDDLYLDEDLGQARIFFNTTGTYNATTLATWSGAALFIALNSIFIMTFLTPKASKKDQNQEYEYYDEDESNLNYDEVVKKRRRYVRSCCDI
jgi:preprotein translocase subunit SecG